MEGDLVDGVEGEWMASIAPTETMGAERADIILECEEGCCEEEGILDPGLFSDSDFSDDPVLALCYDPDTFSLLSLSNSLPYTCRRPHDSLLTKRSI